MLKKYLDARKLSQQLAQAHIVIAARDARIAELEQAIDDLNTSFFLAREDVEGLQSQVTAMNRAWNESVEAFR